jgi:hypothetical protein
MRLSMELIRLGALGQPFWLLVYLKFCQLVKFWATRTSRARHHCFIPENLMIKPCNPYPLHMSGSSIQSIYLEMLGPKIVATNRKIIASGTGFFSGEHVGESTFITAAHNLTGKDFFSGKCLGKEGAIPYALRVWLPDKHCLRWHAVEIEIRDGTETKLTNWGFFEVSGHVMDVAWLNIPKERIPDDALILPYKINGSERSVRPVAFASPARIGIGASVCVAGFPLKRSIDQDKLAISVAGAIASEPRVPFDYRKSNGEAMPTGGWPFFLINVRGYNGLSGSPVYVHNSCHYLGQSGGGWSHDSGGTNTAIGIYTGRLGDPEDKSVSSDLGIVWHCDIFRYAEALVSCAPSEINRGPAPS